MGTIAALTSFTGNTNAVASQVNANFTAIRDVVNTYGLLSDVARTVTVTNTWSLTQTFTGGWTAGAACTVSTGGLTVTSGGLTVSAGTTAVQALTATTGVFTGALSTSSTLAVSGTLTANTHVTSTNTSMSLKATGTASIDLWTDGVSRIVVSATGHFLPVADNAYDLGQGGNTFRDMTLGRNASIGGTLAVTGATTLGAVSATTGDFSGLLTAASGLTVSSGATSLLATTVTGNLTFSGASRKVIPGTTSLIVRNVGDSTDALVVGAADIELGPGAGTTGNLILGADITVGFDFSATTGHVILPTVGGTPTGAVSDGAIIIDEGNHRLYVRSAGAWKYAALT